MRLKYTVSDCIELRRCLEGPNNWELRERDELFKYEQSVLSDLKRSLQMTPEVENIVNAKLDSWIRRTFGGPDKDSIIRLVFFVPLEEVPLWVNVPEVEPFVRWRFVAATKNLTKSEEMC